MSIELPLTIDLLFGETALTSQFSETRAKNETPQWMLRVRLLSEVFVLRALPWNSREKYDPICYSNQEYLKSALNFMSALPELKSLPILELGCGDGLVSMFMKRRGFKGIVTSDIENADSMSILKWNNERNGLYHKHIPFNWGQKFPTSELAQYWKEQVSVDTVDGLDYGPYVAMLHDVCLILANDVLFDSQYFPMFQDTIDQLFSFIEKDLKRVPVLLLGIGSEHLTEEQQKFFSQLEKRDSTSVDPLGKGHNMFLVSLKNRKPTLFI
ncbi:uncharacterized protein LOC134845087 [Symsagittifera roscoffensis]|uniref:uncharacterized protein LOC134845087 n=1 Tax=Symsagittifera roscoffensis TaxID=84072 RepID=UPI00307BDB48